VVELGETLTQTVIREAKEETCLDVSNPTLLDVVDNIDLDAKSKVMYHFVIADYFVTVNGPCEPSAASDAAELQWVPLNEVENYDLTRSFRFFFKRNQHKLEKISSVQ
jgi:ADP-ribose pyrophosphatase YjhB (NUDIX family)